MTAAHDRAAAREDARARGPCRAEACVPRRACERACVRACVRERGGGRAAGAMLADPWVVRHTRHGGARGFSGGTGVYWLRGVGVSVWRMGVACGCVGCAVWHACALKWRVSCSLCVFSFSDLRNLRTQPPENIKYTFTYTPYSN